MSVLSPSEALTAAAQIAVALAGFAGIVAALGKGALHEWSTTDRLRLQLLLTTGLMPLAWCLFGLLLLSADLPDPLVWRTASVVSAVMLMFALTPSVPRALSARTSDGPPVNRMIFVSLASVGVAVALLQIFNALVLGLFWPFFTIIITSMLVCVLQFARLILQRPSA